MPKLAYTEEQNSKKATYLIEFPNSKMRDGFKVLCAKRGVSMKDRIVELIAEDLEKGKSNEIK